MADLAPSTVWGYRALFGFLAGFLLFTRLLPLGSIAGGWPGPDLLFCLALVWVLRRPDYVPPLLIGVVVLLEDLLLMRPPGLWAAITVLAAEFLRNRAALTRELSFAVEWLLAATVIAAAMLGYRLMMMLAMLPQVGLGQAMIHMIVTILCYPLMVLLSRFAFGVRKPATGEVDGYGRRI
jgi:rod shape-determining protein MreD